MTLPEIALSVRQPWTWAIVHGSKDVENRDWKPHNSGLKFRGRVAIHASKGLLQREYDAAKDFMADIGCTCPPAEELKRGGVIGSVEICGVTTDRHSPWFMGPLGLMLRNPEPCTFIPCVGQLGFFRWQESRQIGVVPPTARWMAESRLRQRL